LKADTWKLRRMRNGYEKRDTIYVEGKKFLYLLYKMFQDEEVEE
jgi:hypothetical protein